MADTPLAVMKRIAEKLGYRFGQREEGFWFSFHDSEPEQSIGEYPSKREAYRAALRDYYDANLGNITLEGL